MPSVFETLGHSLFWMLFQAQSMALLRNIEMKTYDRK